MTLSLLPGTGLKTTNNLLPTGKRLASRPGAVQVVGGVIGGVIGWGESCPEYGLVQDTQVDKKEASGHDTICDAK